MSVTGVKALSLCDRADKLLDDAANLSIAAVRDHGWSVAPVESGSHFDTDDAVRIASSLRPLTDTVYAVAVEKLAHVETALEVCVSVDALLEFSRNCGLFAYVLLPPQEAQQFAILCTVEGYILVAGPLQFVERAVGKDIATALEDFRGFASSLTFPEEVRNALERVAMRYARCDPGAI